MPACFSRVCFNQTLSKDSDVERKYREELHANEIVLLAYYIAAVNIEEAYRGRRGEDSDYEPFSGIVLTDTFNLNKKGENPTLFGRAWMPDNNARAERQQKLPIQVIVGNPPWSAGQRSAADDNPNVDYLGLADRIEETYAEYSTVTNKRHLYDSYKMAIRWASDRIKEQGVIAFVTNGSWIDANVDAGIRACLAEEFSSIYILHLRGNARTSGERRRSEGDNVFGQGSRAPVAITIMVKNPRAAHDGCRIRYRDIGDYLSREQKLKTLRETGSISGISEWQTITPMNITTGLGSAAMCFPSFIRLERRMRRPGGGRCDIRVVFARNGNKQRRLHLQLLTERLCRQRASNDGRLSCRALRNGRESLTHIRCCDRSTLDES